MKHKTGDLRVIAFYKKDGYGSEDKIQYLQRFESWIFGYYWKTIDEEVMPKWAWIEQCATGYTEWLSKFIAYGKFGADGYIKKAN